ncbi:hypothetical protein DPMN_008704 [Dreissena polymorpha]|uniref:Uncharacterized protein n=2 Tax=Dreissena polymorpha TaxID=45954 RepID=A0A9D4MVS5_DREPO|nr:hypothetical protein DPMN_008704 [Dreissena polymorpha]
MSGLKNPNDTSGSYYQISKPSYAYTYKFNFKSDVSAVNKARLYANAGACDVYLTKGRIYVVSGRVDKEKQRMEIDMCSSWVETTPISSESKRLLIKFKRGTVLCPK